jgi:hypothetical protein
MAVFNRWRRAHQGDPAWIARADAGRVCLATVAGGRWRKLTFKSLGADWRTDLTTVLERELLLADEPAPPKVVFAYAPGVPAFDLPDWTEGAGEYASLPVPFPLLASADAEYAIGAHGIA